MTFKHIGAAIAVIAISGGAALALNTAQAVPDADDLLNGDVDLEACAADDDCFDAFAEMDAYGAQMEAYGAEMAAFAERMAALGERSRIMGLAQGYLGIGAGIEGIEDALEEGWVEENGVRRQLTADEIEELKETLADLRETQREWREEHPEIIALVEKTR